MDFYLIQTEHNNNNNNNIITMITAQKIRYNDECKTQVQLTITMMEVNREKVRFAGRSQELFLLVHHVAHI